MFLWRPCTALLRGGSITRAGWAILLSPRDGEPYWRGSPHTPPQWIGRLRGIGVVEPAQAER